MQLRRKYWSTSWKPAFLTIATCFTEPLVAGNFAMTCVFDSCREKGRYSSETRPQDYLRQEYKTRLSKGPVRYLLQLQLHEPGPDDSHLVTNLSRVWDEETHPWMDLADVVITSLLPPDVTERTCYAVDKMPVSLGFLPVETFHDSSCIMPLRAELYRWTQKIRLLRRPRALPDHMTNYLIRVETGDQSKAGTNATISMTLIGTYVLIAWLIW